MSTWVLASGNNGKLAELTSLLHNSGINLVPQGHFGVSEATENGLSFIENAIIKARWASRHTQLPALADDSGLAVKALGGAPGIYSARYAGATASDADNNARLLAELAAQNPTDRSATFHCVLAFVQHAKDPTPLICHGVWHGTILTAGRGSNGFGYDPLFYIPALGRSAAELGNAEKAAVSHRANAMAQFKQQLQLESTE